MAVFLRTAGSVMENVYKTPEAPLVETRGAKRAHFFVTSWAR